VFTLKASRSSAGKFLTSIVFSGEKREFQNQSLKNLKSHNTKRYESLVPSLH
jgi:hypothetical protein